MKISPLAKQIPDYPFIRVARISREVEKRDGVSVINARIGIPDMEAPSSIKKAMSEFLLEERSTFGYPIDVHPERGIPELIDAIIDHYQIRYSVTLKPENILVTGWTKEILHNITRLFDSGSIQIPDPVYPAYEAATILSNHKIERVRTSADSGWLPEFDLSQQDTVAFYFCDPNNPTGSVASKGYYLSLAEEMKKNDVTGIFDKAYKDYIFDDSTQPLSITQIPGLIDNGYEIVSFSKHYNFVGIGLGWVVSSEDNIRHWMKFNGQFSQGVEWYKQKAGAFALTSSIVKEEMREYYEILKERRDIFAKGLDELGFKVDIPVATPYLWIKVPDGYDDEDFVLNRLIDKAHVALMPGVYFGENGKGYCRATIFLPKDKIEEALDRISRIRDW
ncbi:MAG: pyridoxal phosphate-dependent aminotransferase [Dehalococcoidales bacterium]|nr:pyridoxal phosphate-dependent aminotransferase [Dehalococcoidales bacterium]